MEDIDKKLSFFLNRSSVRSYTQQKIDKDTLDKILRSALQAPTSSHVQAFAIVNVTETAKRQALWTICGQQNWIVEASHFFILCADLHKVTLWANLNPDQISQDAYLAAIIDGGLVGMTLSLAAESLGIGSVFIGSIRNDLEGVAKILELPQQVVPLFGLCMGYYDSKKAPKPRLPKELLVFENTYKLPENNKDLLEEYHKTLNTYYKDSLLEHKGLKKQAETATWLDVTGASVCHAKRRDMGEFLQRRGFPLGGGSRS